MHISQAMALEFIQSTNGGAITFTTLYVLWTLPRRVVHFNCLKSAPSGKIPTDVPVDKPLENRNTHMDGTKEDVLGGRDG